MNFKTTLALLVLTAAGAGLVFVGTKVPSLFDSSSGKAVPDSGTRAALEKLKADDLTRIEIRRGAQTTTLVREGTTWTLPGKWETRAPEVKALVAYLGDLRSRFEPIPTNDDTDLVQYGLNSPPLTVKLETDNAKYQFVLGEPPPTGDGNQFSTPTYLRLLSGPGIEKPLPEVVRLGPGAVAFLNRPTDYYQQRSLFKSERTVREDNNQKVDRLDAKSVRVEETKEGGAKFTLVRKDKSWELDQPTRDQLETNAREALLTALPNLWAERFDPTDVPTVLAAFSGAGGLTSAGWLAMTTPGTASKWLVARAGLEPDKAERKITVERDNGDKFTLLIGVAAIPRTKRVLRPPPPGVPAPPREEFVPEEYRYAKLLDNDQIFEIKAEPLKDVFVKTEALREPRLARFSVNEVKDVEIARPGEETIALTKEDERWKLVKPLKAEADFEKVNELLTKLSSLEARGENIIDKDDASHGFDQPGIAITVKWESETKDADGSKVKKSLASTLKLGKDDKEKKKLYVKTDHWPRVNVVDDSLVALVNRPALAYRGKRLLDFTASDVAAIDVQRGSEKLTLKQDKQGWKLVAPVEAKIDGGKVNQLVDALGRLEVVDFVNDAPTKEDLTQKYGVGDDTALVVKITFSDASKPGRTLRLGKVSDTKPGFFGKMDDSGSVFLVDGGIHAQLDRDSLAYLPAELWQLLPDELTGVRIKREGHDEYTLKRSANKWQITGPFDAPARPDMAGALMEDFATVRCESHKAHEAKDLAKYGLDKPSLTIVVFGKDDKETHTLLIGAPVEKDSHSRYAKVADQPGVCVIGEQVVEAGEVSALTLLDPTLLRLDPAKIERITTKNGDKTLTLLRHDGWQVLDTPASPFPADKEAMSPRQFPWSNLRADKFDAYGAKVDWTKYGLDKPVIVVTLVVTDGDPKEHTIELGKHVNGDTGPRYARVDKGQGVAVLNPIVSQLLARSYLDYVNRHVLQFKADDVTQIQRKKGNETLDVTRTADSWQIVKPAEQRADDKTLQDLVGQLADLKAERVAAFPAMDLKTYGLDDSAAMLITIKLKADAKPAEYLVKLGKPVEAGGAERYAVIGDSMAVVVLPAALSKRLAAASITFRDRSLARFADADKLRLERGPRQAVFARVEGSWKLTEPIAADADSDELDDFLNTLAKLRADELVAEKPTAEELKSYGLDKPEARWKLMAGDAEVLNLVIGGREKGGIRRYAQLAGKDIVFLLDPKLSMRCLAEFRTRTVWPMPLDAAQVESVRYVYANKPFVLEKTQTGWQVEGKPDVKPNTATVNETLAALAGLKLLRYVVDKGADFKLFGLEPPELMIEITTRTGQQTLYIGRQEGDSKRLYARIPGKDRSDVFVIDDADAAKILRDVTAFTKAPERPMPPIPPAPMR